MCCDDMELINDNAINISKKCRRVNGYQRTPEYIDFFNNIYRIKKKICV